MQWALWQSPSCDQSGWFFCGPGVAGVPPGTGEGRCDAFPLEESASHEVSPDAFVLMVIAEVFP